MKFHPALKVWVLLLFVSFAWQGDKIFAETPFAPDTLMLETDDIVFSSEDNDNDAAEFYTVRIGRGEKLSGSPFNFLWKHSLSQSVYLSDEIGVLSGRLEGIQYRIRIGSPLHNVHITMWVGEMARDNFIRGWEENPSMQQVFDGRVDFLTGQNTFFVPFEMPYYYKGGNLLVHIRKSGESLTGENFFITTEQPLGSVRVLRAQRDNEPYNIFEPEEIGMQVNDLPNVNLFFSAIGLEATRSLEAAALPVAEPAERPARHQETRPQEITPDRTRPVTRPSDRDYGLSSANARMGLIISYDLRNDFSVGLDASLNLYDGDYINAIVLPGTHLSFGFLQSRPFSLSWSLGIGRVESRDIFHANLMHTGVDFKYRLTNNFTYGSPYVRAGGGILYHTEGTSIEGPLSFDDNLIPFINLGAGYEWLFNENMSLLLSFGNWQMLSDDLDGLEHGKYNDRIWTLDLGFKYYFGSGRRR